jgi:predicted Zn-dependent protease
MRGRMPPPARLTPAAEAIERLGKALEASPADRTALTWIESWRQVAAPRAATARVPRLERELLARVEEAGRPGAYRAAGPSPVELAEACRHAMARARGAERVAGGVPLAPGREGARGDELRGEDLHDPAIAAMALEEGQERLRALLRDGEWGRIAWWEVALTVVASGGVARHLRATGIGCELRCGRRPGAGFAAGAARTLAALDLAALAERARGRDAGGEGRAASDTNEAGPPAGGAVVLAAEATADLLAALAPHLLAAASWEDPAAFPRRHQGQRVLAPALTVREDCTRSPGLPFPLGLGGGTDGVATVIDSGTLRGPVADPLEAAALAVPATGRAWSAAPSSPRHLHLMPGTAPESELVSQAEEGVFVGALERVEVFDAGRLAARLATRARRRITGGRLAGALPDATWEVELPQALATVLALGSEVVTREDGAPFGGVTAPGITLPATGLWR